MPAFHLTILGCGSALPAAGRQPSSQYLHIGKHRFLIDCGEGTQHLIRKHRLKLQGISHIFITHMHGDHFLGLMGLLFSMTLLGRTKPISIVGPPDLKELVDMHLKHAKAGLKYEVQYIFTEVDEMKQVLDTSSAEVWTVPLDHKVATTGFIFKEKPSLRKLKVKKLEYYNVPLKDRKSLTVGEDWTSPDGEVISNSVFTEDPIHPMSYAYCSDTAYIPELADKLHGVDLLYHESTFEEKDKKRAEATRHSTAAQAAKVAADARVGQLLLGHYSARYEDLTTLHEEAKSVFPNSILSKEGLQVDIHDFLS